MHTFPISTLQYIFVRGKTSSDCQLPVYQIPIPDQQPEPVCISLSESLLADVYDFDPVFSVFLRLSLRAVYPHAAFMRGDTR